MPDGRTTTRPSSPSAASHARTASQTVSASASSAFRTARTFTSFCGNRCITAPAVARSSPRATSAPEQVERRRDPVARGAVRQVDQVATLLAPEHVAAPAHLLEHVAVAHVGPAHLDAGLRHGAAETEVGHGGRHHGVVGQAAAGLQAERADRQDLVAVNRGPARVDRQRPVAVAVEGEAEVGADGADGLPHQVEVRRSAAVVDVDAVRLGSDAGSRARPGARRSRGRSPPWRPGRNRPRWSGRRGQPGTGGAPTRCSSWRPSSARHDLAQVAGLGTGALRLERRPRPPPRRHPPA